MEQFTEFLFGNRFFELPFLEAMSYIVAFLLIGAMIVGIIRRLMGIQSQVEATDYATEYHEETYPAVEPYQQEWRKAA